MRRHNRGRLIVVWLATLVLFLVELFAAARADQAEPIAPVPRNVAVDQTRASLGERLFHDVRLSRYKTHSCATCHPLSRGGMDGLPVARRPVDGLSLRNTPTIFNAALNASFNWDGVASTLEDHTDIVVRGLMGMAWRDLVARLQSDPAYRIMFRAAYQDEVTQSSIVNAIVTFERTLLTADAPFDRSLRGTGDALSERAKDGYRRFRDYGCTSCHQGVNVGGNMYQRFGIFESVSSTSALPMDPGRFRLTLVARDMEVFRVPSLRNVAVTAPYFHDGRASTLEEAVDTMGQRQLGRTLGKQDIRLIVEFLQSLTGRYDGRLVKASRSAPAGAPVAP